MKAWIGVHAFFLLLFFLSAVRADDLKFSADFNFGIADLQTQGIAEFAQDNTQGHLAPGAARLTIAGAVTPAYQQFSKVFQPIKGEDEFSASVWVRTRDVHDGTGAYMVLEFLDAQNQRAGIAHSTVNLGNGAQNWQQLAVEGAAPANAVAVRVGLILHAHGTAWFDELEFARTRSGVALPDLGIATRVIAVHPERIVQSHFAGVGFHVFHHVHPMSETMKNEVVYKRWREINPSFARLNDSNKWTEAQKQEVADHLRRIKQTGTEIYMAAWDPEDVPPGAARRDYAKQVAGRLEWLRKNGSDTIKWYCLTNELQMGRWGALLGDLPKFRDYHQELFNEFKARQLPIGLLATDASPISNWNTLDWAAQNMDATTAIYGAHHYFVEYAPDNPRFYDWFQRKLSGAVQVAHSKKKEFILGEFGSKQDGRVINGKRMDACVYFDTSMEPFVGLQLAEAAIASLNAGVYAIGYWTFMDFPDLPGDYANKWGLTKWSGDDHSTRDIYYAYGPLAKFFRGPSQVATVISNDPWLRAGALRHANGTWSVAVVNRYRTNVPLQLNLPGVTGRFRKYLYDAGNVKKNPFGDLPGPVATLEAEGSLHDTLGPNTLTIYTTEYDDRSPASVKGLKTTGTALTWQPNNEADFCYYRVFRGTVPNFTPSSETQIASTIATNFSDTTHIAGGAYYKVVAVDQSGNASK